MKTSGKKTMKLNVSGEARGKIITTVAKKATGSGNRSGMYSICNEEEDRREYTHISPHGPLKKKKTIMKRSIEESTLALFHEDPEEEEDEEEENTCINKYSNGVSVPSQYLQCSSTD